jgi:hypothetical protein
MTRTTYSRKLRRVTWLSFLIPTAVGLPLALLFKTAQPGPGEHFWLVLGGIVFVFAVSFAAALPWWRTMDDMQRQGHTISWYWGGLGGGSLMFAWLIAALGGESDTVKGAVAMLLAQIVGFLIFWAVWMWRQRGAGE